MMVLPAAMKPFTSFVHALPFLVKTHELSSKHLQVVSSHTRCTSALFARLPIFFPIYLRVVRREWNDNILPPLPAELHPPLKPKPLLPPRLKHPSPKLLQLHLHQPLPRLNPHLLLHPRRTAPAVRRSRRLIPKTPLVPTGAAGVRVGGAQGAAGAGIGLGRG
jgi:hypothetical protein